MVAAIGRVAQHGLDQRIVAARLGEQTRQQEERRARMIEQALADRRHVGDELAADALDVGARPDAGAQQHPRRVDRAGAQHDALGGNRLDVAVRVLDLDAAHAAVA